MQLIDNDSRNLLKFEIYFVCYIKCRHFGQSCLLLTMLAYQTRSTKFGRYVFNDEISATYNLDEKGFTVSGNKAAL